MSFTVFSGDIKKKKSENDQSTGHFQSFFFVPPTLSDIFPHKSPNLYKKILALDDNKTFVLDLVLSAERSVLY